jgi:hypothetical protein
MPKQQIFFEQQIGNWRVEVLKSYDQGYAREVFLNLNDEALRLLWKSLTPEQMYEPDSLPKFGIPGGGAENFLWDELLEQAREEGNLLSFFIVNVSDGRQSEGIYVSADWPSAESYAKLRLTKHSA